MSAVDIDRASDLREGDVATFAFEGHEFTGEVWSDSHGHLQVGSQYVVDVEGEVFPLVEFISASRPVTPFPEQHGSIILASVKGKFGKYRFARAYGSNAADRPWIRLNFMHDAFSEHELDLHSVIYRGDMSQ